MQLPDSLDIDRAPIATRPSRREAIFVRFAIDRFSNTVDPAKAKSDIDRLGPYYARLPGSLFPKADPLLIELFVVLLESLTQIGSCLEEFYVIAHPI